MSNDRISNAHRAYVGLMLLWSFLIANLACGGTTSSHDPTIWEKDIRAFEASDHKHMPSPGGVLFVGSSSIRFWDLKHAFPHRNVINRGFGGSWSCDSLYYTDRIVIPYKPRTIIFYAGDNDIAGGGAPEEVANSFRQFVKKVHASLPDTRIVFISIKPSIARWAIWDRMRTANTMVRQFADHTPRVEYVDISKDLIGANGHPRK
ncbi:MAG TPA: GDSL-type esterase/lipase family protein, partial [Tepidisphaeraceae bacterium]|nr:GDSL-type esterase/lipase family protein [Tepidisphaeraceae bacterium]